jgi:hypothetical protein
MRKDCQTADEVQIRKCLLFHSFARSIRCDNKMLSWPNSPLLVLLQCIGPNVLLGEGEVEPLHHWPTCRPFRLPGHKTSSRAKQLMNKYGANVNSVVEPTRRTLPLHKACCCGQRDQLDFVELLLKAGADPNALDHTGGYTVDIYRPRCPGAAEFLLNWPTTDANIIALDLTVLPGCSPDYCRLFNENCAVLLPGPTTIPA